MIGLLKKAIVDLPIRMKGNSKRTSGNRPLPSSKNPHFQNEARGTTFLVKMSFICMRKKHDFHIEG